MRIRCSGPKLAKLLQPPSMCQQSLVFLSLFLRLEFFHSFSFPSLWSGIGDKAAKLILLPRKVNGACNLKSCRLFYKSYFIPAIFGRKFERQTCHHRKGVDPILGHKRSTGSSSPSPGIINFYWELGRERERKKKFVSLSCPHEKLLTGAVACSE